MYYLTEAEGVSPRPRSGQSSASTSLDQSRPRLASASTGLDLASASDCPRFHLGQSYIRLFTSYLGLKNWREGSETRPRRDEAETSRRLVEAESRRGRVNPRLRLV